MSEFSSGAASGPQWSPPDEPAAAVPAAPQHQRSGLPSWLPYFLLAVVPAVVAGLVVFATTGGSGGGSDAASLVDSLFRLSGDEVESFADKLPPGLPSDIPAYPGSKVVVSFLIRSAEGSNYIVLYQTSTDTKKVIDYYQKALDESPWQVESGVASDDLNGVFFSRPDDADVQGTVQVRTSDLGGQTTIYLSFEDVSPSSSVPPSEKFVLPANLSLPSSFPTDIPIYEGKDQTTVTAVQFQRGSGTTRYLVTFLTKNSDVDVIDFYRKEFTKRGWQVTDGTPLSSRDFSLAIDFQDGARQLVQGTIRADAFEEDATYTRVDLQLQVSATRGRGN